MNTYSTQTATIQGEQVEVTFEYVARQWPTEYYRATLSASVVGDEAEEDLVEHVNENHLHGATFDYWIDDDHKVAQFTLDASIWGE